MKISAIIFDMDGLMLDTERMAREAWLRAMAELGYDFPEQIYHQIVGITVSDAKGILQKCFGADFPVNEAYRRKQQFAQEAIEEQVQTTRFGRVRVVRLTEQGRLILETGANSASTAA